MLGEHRFFGNPLGLSLLGAPPGSQRDLVGACPGCAGPVDVLGLSGEWIPEPLTLAIRVGQTCLDGNVGLVESVENLCLGAGVNVLRERQSESKKNIKRSREVDNEGSGRLGAIY